MKIIIVVLTYLENNHYKALYTAQNETWNSIKVDGIETFFLIGDCKEDKIYDDFICTTVNENSNCSLKMINCFKLIRGLDFDFMFRTNATSYVDKKGLKDFIVNNCNVDSYCGVQGSDFVSGAGIILSKKNCDLISDNLDMWDINLQDDVAIGRIASSLNIVSSDAPRIDISLNSPVNSSYFHYRCKIWQGPRENEPEILHNVHRKKLSSLT